MKDMSGSGAFAAYLAEHLPLVDAWIRDNAWAPGAEQASDLSAYLYAPVARFTAGAGKRVRPVLALLACEAVSGSAQTALATACSIELFQTAALIHDDIADHGETRRGEPCLHVSLGEGLAINAGDAALVEASDAILADEGLSASTKLAVLAEMVHMQRMTLEGQALDLGWVRDGRWDVGPGDYLAMAIRKTAHYTCASPLVLGAIVGGADAERQEALRSFGLDAGLAFQIADDLLNLVGDAKAQGKDFRSDITEGKRTLAAVSALATLEAQDRDELQGILAAGTSDPALLGRAVELMEKAGAIEAARAKAEALAQSAIGHLERAQLSGDAHEKLVSMAHFFIERAS